MRVTHSLVLIFLMRTDNTVTLHFAVAFHLTVWR